MEEIWKDIKGYEKVYQVSNLGRVRSLDRYVEDINKTQFIKGRILKPLNNGNNYLEVHLRKDNARKKRYIHRLVAEAFINNYGEDKAVNHKDFNTENNSVFNLEMVTTKENVRYSINNGRYEEGRKRAIEIRKNKTNIKKKTYEKDILYLYVEKQQPVETINNQLGVSKNIIYEVLKENDVVIRGYKVIRLVQTKGGKIIQTHDNSKRAANWLVKNNYTKSKYSYEAIRDCLNNKREEAYGFGWKLI